MGDGAILGLRGRRGRRRLVAGGAAPPAPVPPVRAGGPSPPRRLPPGRRAVDPAGARVDRDDAPPPRRPRAGAGGGGGEGGGCARRRRPAARRGVLPLSRGNRRPRDEALDPVAPAGELLLRPPVVGRHLLQELPAGPLVAHGADVVLLPHGPPGQALVMPEVEVPMATDLAHARAAPDLHVVTSK